MANVAVGNTTAGITAKTIDLLESDQTITGLKTFSRSTNAPFAVNSGAAKVTNLDADKLDGEEGSAFHAAANLTGQVAIANGGTGAATAAANLVFAGPTSGSAAAPSFRALVAADLTGSVSSLDHDTSSAEVVSTATETTVYTFSVPANTLSTNRALRVTVIGDYLNNTGGAAVFTFNVKYGSTTCLTAGWSTSANANRKAFLGQFTLSAANSTSAQVASGWASLADGADTANANGTMTTTQGSTNKLLAGTNNAIAENSTGALNLVLTADHDASSANLSFICRAVHVELI